MPGPPSHILPPEARELVARYVAGLAWRPVTIALVGVAALVALSPWLSRLLERRAARLGALAVAIAAALVAAWRVKWVADDAFISFRYAENLARGHGLVWNPGERVEGYTNFLWTVLLAGAIRVHLDPVRVSVVLGLTSYALLLVTVFRLGWRLLSEKRRALALLPLALAATNPYLISFATSGLETMFVALMVTLAFERAEAGWPRAAGLCAAAALMAHPDQAILVAALAGALALDRARRREALVYCATVAAVFVPYYLLRWWYYGEFWTNTYYTKSASAAYFSQGFTYLGMALLSGGLWGLIVPAIVGMTARRARLLRFFCGLGAPLFLFYIAKIGG
ncbi:MAG TPA: hypothetical protein VHO06_19155, partial [Polyangia bacterium]|nr:hypothetical protein [Polyangia bacterium]